MSVITFLNSGKEQTGKTMSIAAIATYMAIEHNYRILVVSTTTAEDSFKRCFWEEKKTKKDLGIFGPNARIEVENGVEGLVRLIKSNRVAPETITNYTKVVFKDRLEFLLGSEIEKSKNNNLTIKTEQDELSKAYPDIISVANQYYDMVFVDLDSNVDEDNRENIMKNSNIIVMNMSQRLRTLDEYIELKEKKAILQSKRTLIMIGKYDKFSKYNSKNISRYLKEKNQVLTIPYNTLFFEATEEAGVPDLFLRFRKSIDPEDRNAFFIDEVKRASENIIYRLQDLQMRM